MHGRLSMMLKRFFYLKESFTPINYLIQLDSMHQTDSSFCETDYTNRFYGATVRLGKLD